MKHHPHTVRLVLSGHADREAVLRLVGPAHQYLSKPCDAGELRLAIERALTLRDLLANEQLKELTSRIGTLPSLPSLHLQLTEELRKQDPSVERIAEIISKDIGMTTKVLQLVNSAFFGLAQPATNPMEAVMFLGLATVRSLVFSLQIFSQFDERPIKNFSIDGLAQHCWATGWFARRIAEAEHCGPKIDDQCFLAGLVHDVGQLILATTLPEPYARVLHEARDSDRPVWEIEQAEFGATHAEVGAYLLGLWGLPYAVVEAIALHHAPQRVPHQSFDAASAVYIANLLAEELDSTTAIQGDSELPGDQQYLTSLGIQEDLPSWRVMAAKVPSMLAAA